MIRGTTASKPFPLAGELGDGSLLPAGGDTRLFPLSDAAARTRGSQPSGERESDYEGKTVRLCQCCVE